MMRIVPTKSRKDDYLNKDQKQLLNQAMKYKNMFESYEINTGGAYQIENIAFYLVVYSKKYYFKKKLQEVQLFPQNFQIQ